MPPSINDALPALMEESFRQHERLLYAISLQFPHLGTQEERLSLAAEAWLKAFHSFDPNNAGGASFTTWVRFKAEKILLDQLREVKKSNHLRQWPREGLDCTRNDDRFDLEQFSLGLSEDAREVIRATIQLRGRSPDMLWWRLFAAFLARGWEQARVLQAFREIEENLT